MSETILYPTRKSLENVGRLVRAGLAAAKRPHGVPLALLPMALALEGIAKELYIPLNKPAFSTHAVNKVKRHRHAWVDHPASKATLVIQRCNISGCPAIKCLAPVED